MRSVLSFAVLVAALALSGAASADKAEPVGTTSFTVALAGPGGSGTADLRLTPGGKVCYVIEVTLTTPGDVPQEPAPGIGNAHIHVLPSGAIAVPLESTFESLGDAMFRTAGCVRAEKELVRAILANPEQYYVNVHTAAFPGGAVSGTLA